MKQTTTSLPANWPQQLAQGDSAQQLALLPQIELLARGQAGAYAALLPLTQAEDFALRLRAYLALGRLGQAGAFLPLVEQLKQERQTVWRLMLLDTLHALPQTDKISPLLPILAEDQAGDGDGYFLCGLVWFLGQQGEAALPALSRHILTSPARTRRIKDKLLREAFWLAAGGDLRLLERYAAADPPLARFCRFRLWPEDTRAHFGIFPNPDYLYQNARKNGLSQAQYKQLFYWYRSKQSGLPPPIKRESEADFAHS